MKVFVVTAQWDVENGGTWVDSVFANEEKAESYAVRRTAEDKSNNYFVDAFDVL